MQKVENIHAYIDGANLHNAVKNAGWEIDYSRFRIWLKEKHSVQSAYIFLGFISKYAALYKELQEAGYILVFRDVVYDQSGKPKGNCDADMVLQVTCDFFQKAFTKCVIVTSDGDYTGLVKLLKKEDALELLLSPASFDRCSILLRKCNIRIASVQSIRNRICKRKSPQ